MHTIQKNVGKNDPLPKIKRYCARGNDFQYKSSIESMTLNRAQMFHKNTSAETAKQLLAIVYSVQNSPIEYVFAVPLIITRSPLSSQYNLPIRSETCWA